MQKNVRCLDAMKMFFISSSGAILFVTGLAKVISVWGSASILNAIDPIVGFRFRHLLLFVGVIEIVISLFCFRFRNQTWPFFVIGWLATSFLVYRIGLWVIGWQKPCKCLGNLTDALHISPRLAEMGMRSILAYLLIGSYATLFWLWQQRGKAEGRM